MTVISNENQAPAMGNVPVHGLTLRGRQHNQKRTSNVCFSRHAICYWSQTHYYFHCICIFWIARLRVKGLSYVPPEQKEALIVDKAVRPRDVQHGAAEDNVNAEGIINLSTLHLFIYLPTQTSLMHVNPPLTHTCFWSVSLKGSVWIGPEGNVDGDEACFNLEQRKRPWSACGAAWAFVQPWVIVGFFHHHSTLGRYNPEHPNTVFVVTVVSWNVSTSISTGDFVVCLQVRSPFLNSI